MKHVDQHGNGGDWNAHGKNLALDQENRLHHYKGRSTLVPIVPKITARWRQMEFCIFCAKSRQNERSSVVSCLNVNKLSREFFHDFFFGEKSRQNERSSALCSLNVNKVSRIFS